MKQINDKHNKSIKFLISTLRPDGEFITSFVGEQPTRQQSTISSRLQAISLMLSYPSDIKTKAKCALLPIQEKEFMFQDDLCIIHEERSLVLWNCLLAIIYLKSGDLNKSFMLLQGVRKSIRNDDSIDNYYTPGTNRNLQNAVDVSTSTGLVGIAFLHAYRQFHDEIYLDLARKCAHIAILKPRYDVYDAWLLRFLHEIKADAKYDLHATRLINGMLGASLASMSSLVAALTIQASLSWDDGSEYALDKRQKVDAVLDHLLSMQTDDGRFVKAKHINETRIDYNVHGVWALLQYDEIVNNQKPPLLSLVV